MSRRGILSSLGIAAWLLCAAAGARAQAGGRSIVCYVVTEEGASSEGNSLFMSRMGADPEAVKTFALSRFTNRGGVFRAEVQGRLSYQAGTPVLKDRSGRLALYAIPLKLLSDPPPRARKVVTVRFSLKELASGRGMVQPATRAMELAADKAGMRSGLAWIVQMDMPSRGQFRAKVALAD